MTDIEISLDDEDDEELAKETTVEVEGVDESLTDLMKDVAVAHQRLDEYKNGSLKLVQALDERIIEAEMADETDRVRLLQDVKKSAHGVHLRLERGDAELLGERDGKHSGYFNTE